MTDDVRYAVKKYESGETPKWYSRNQGGAFYPQYTPEWDEREIFRDRARAFAVLWTNRSRGETGLSVVRIRRRIVAAS